VLESSPLVAFVSTADAAGARRFYAETLGLPMLEQTSFACVFDANGTMLRVTVVDEVVRAPYTVLGWGVADLPVAIGELAARGVEFDRHEGMQQDGLGIWQSPSGARVAWFKDPDGNILSLTQR
jgi:catechol 2,3-dioxygenase-like lactoylglutathione lyase family enzyme